MTTPYKIAIGILLAACLFLYFGKMSYQKKWNRSERDYAALLDSIKNVKPQIDTVWRDSITKETITIYHSDTVQVDTTQCQRREYNGVFNSDFLAVRWRAVVFGELSSIDLLPSSSYRFPEITIQKTIIPPERTPITVRNEARSMLMLHGDILITSGFDGAGLGVTYIRKEGWGISGGFMSNSAEWYYRVGLLMKIR